MTGRQAPTLTDGAGTPLAEILLDEVVGKRWAIVQAMHAPAAAVAPALLATYAGHRAVTDDDDLAALLVAGGGTVARQAHDYTYDLAGVPPGWADTVAPQGFALSPVTGSAALAEAHAAAVPPGHPDHDPDLDHADDLRAMLAGEIFGPNVSAATWQVGDDHGACGAIIVSERGPGGTWVLDVFVDPRHHGKGLGRALLRRSLAGAAQAGYATMGLVVTEGNPARRLYDSTGFLHTGSGSSVDLPSRGDAGNDVNIR